MGARSGGGGGARGGGVTLTMQDMKQAQKNLTSAQSQMTKAHNNYISAKGGVLVAQNDAAKIKAAARLDKALKAYTNSIYNYNKAKGTMDAMTEAYQSGKKYYPKK